MDPAQIERKRAQAAVYRGVYYDPAGDAFVAEIYVSGKRRYLGRFRTAEEASGTYLRERELNPIVRQTSSNSYEAVYADFLASCRSTKRGDPLEDEEFVYDGQTFTYLRTSFAKPNGVTRPYYVFGSHCKTCSGWYETRISPSGGRGITRNCEEHRKASPWGQKAAVFKVGEPSATAQHKQDLLDLVDSCAEDMGFACEEMPLSDFAAFCRKTDVGGVIDKPELLEKSIVRWSRRDEAMYTIMDCGDGEPLVVFA